MRVETPRAYKGHESFKAYIEYVYTAQEVVSEPDEELRTRDVFSQELRDIAARILFDSAWTGTSFASYIDYINQNTTEHLRIIRRGK